MPEITKEYITEKVNFIHSSSGILINEKQRLKIYCHKCIEEKIFCKHCIIDYRIKKLEEILDNGL